ncbi:MAG: fatty acid desaturase [Cyanobacteria bacterium P01_F01_bin.86]
MTANLSGAPKQRPNFKVRPTPPPLDWVTIGFFTLFHGLALLAPWFFSWSALGIAILLHWLFGGVGICLGYHRLLSHRSFQVPQWLEYSVATLGALAIEGGPIFWVGGHRRHHAFTEDVEQDPYSAKRGFWWSHMLWILHLKAIAFDNTEYGKHAPDLVRQPFYRWLDRNFLLLQVPLAILLYWLGGWSFVVYGIFVRAVLLWHSTWLVNSATHRWGYRSFDADDNARNLWWVSLLTYGEGWHNNHHTYPRSAQTGWRWWEIDVTWQTIKLLQRLGLATKVNRIPLSRR